MSVVNNTELSSIPDHIHQDIQERITHLSAGIGVQEGHELLSIIHQHIHQKHPFDIHNKEDKRIISLYLSLGGAVVHPFGNIYAISAHPHLNSIISVNTLKGRPGNQISSITTSPEHFIDLFATDALPPTITADLFQDIIHALNTHIGVFGIRGSATSHIQKHFPHFLQQTTASSSNVQLIAVGTEGDPHHELVREYKHISANEYILSITSANLSRHIKGHEEPAHYRLEGVLEDLGNIFPVIGYIDKDAEKKHMGKFPHLRPTSTSVISLNYTVETPSGKQAFILERDGSASYEHLKEVIEHATHGTISLVRGSSATQEIAQRNYASTETLI